MYRCVALTHPEGESWRCLLERGLVSQGGRAVGHSVHHVQRVSIDHMTAQTYIHVRTQCVHVEGDGNSDDTLTESRITGPVSDVRVWSVVGSSPTRGSSFSRKSDCLGYAVLLCLVCLFDLACFFHSSFSSLILKRVYLCEYMSKMCYILQLCISDACA